MKTRKFSNITVCIICTLLPGITGCTGKWAGIDAAVKPATTEIVQLQKIYAVDYHQAVQETILTLNSLPVSGAGETADELETSIKVKRRDGTSVTVNVVQIEDGVTGIGIRTETEGIPDNQESQRIQEYLGAALTDQAGGNPVVLKPSKKKVAPKSSGRPAVKTNTVKGLAAVSGQKNPPAGAGNGYRKQELAKPADELGDSAGGKDLVIYFENNSNDLSGEEVEKINQAAEMIRRYPEAVVTLNGYPDLPGNVEYNTLLSESRAIAVKLYLISKGIKQNTITVVSHGETGTTARGGEIPLSRVEIAIDKVNLAE